MKGKLWKYMLTVLAALCMCFGFAACGEEKPSEKQPLAAPQDVKIEENILSWKAVEGAEEYTVKINNDETTKVSAATLDLTTVTAKLTEGENTLSVKASETKEKAESPYSQAVKYTYAPPPAEHTHTLTKHEAKEATCTAAGNSLYYECSGCGKFFSDDKGEHEVKENSWVVAAKGHSYGEPTWEWTGDDTNGYTTATATFTCSNCTDKQVKTATVTHETTKAAACITAGTETYTATAEFEEKSYTDEKEVTLAATGHSYGGWVITAPSATEKGKAVKTCQNCAEGTEGHTQEKELPVLGDENYQTTDDTATCTQTGKVKYTITLDGEKFEFEVETPVLGHSWDEAWTTESGRHWHACTRCGEKNEEAACGYSAPAFAWTGSDGKGYTAATATFTCTTCSNEVTKQATVAHTSKAPTCTAAGAEIYTATVEFGEETYTAKKEVTVAAKGHSYGTPTWSWTESSEEATATFRCSVCGDTQTQTATVTREEQQTGCTVKAVFTATVTFGGSNYTETATKDLPDRHTFGAWQTEVPATCVAKGTKGHYTCNVCRKNFAQDQTTELTDLTTPIDANAHDLQTVEAKEATCTEAGYSAHKKCIRQGCGYEEAYTTTPAKGHSYGTPTWTWTGSDEEGYTAAKATFTCNTCHEPREETAEVTSETTKEASCTETGTAKYTATVTVEFGTKTYTEEKQVTLAKTAHKLQKHERVEPTLTATGTEEYWQCETCEKYFSDDKGENPIEGPVSIDKLTTTPAADEYERLVGLIDENITESSSAKEAEELKAALDAAAEQYGKLNEDEKDLDKVSAAKTVFDEKQGAFDKVYNPAKALAEAYKEAVEAATAENAKEPKKTAEDDGKTLASLNEKLEAAKTAKEALNTELAKSLGEECDAAYSEVETAYTAWQAEVEKEVTDYTGLVEAIPEAITAYSTQEDATAAKEKLDAAAAKYGDLSYEAKENEQVKKALETYTTKNNAYTTETGKAQTDYEGFKSKLTSAQEAAKAEASVAALDEAIKAANSAKEGLSTLASGLVKTEDTEALTALGKTLETWQAAVETAKATLKVETELTDDVSAEKIITEAAASLEAYEGFAAYVKADSGVEAAKSAVETAQQAAETKLQNSVDALKQKVNAALGMEDTDKDKAFKKYQALRAAKTEIGKLGNYAKGLYTDYSEDETKIQSAIDALTKEVAKTEDFETYLHTGGKGNYILIRTFYNKLGEPIKLASDPTVTASATATWVTDGQQLSVITEVVYNADGYYIATITFDFNVATNVDASAVNYFTLTYRWNSDADKTVKVATYKDNLYNMDTDHRLYNVDGKRKDFGNKVADVANCYDIYYAEDIDVGDAYGDTAVTISGRPIIQGVTDGEEGIGNTLADLTRYLAKQGFRGEMDLRLVVYQKWVVGDVTQYTRINTNSVSEELHFNLTDEDEHFKLELDLENGTWGLGDEDGSIKHRYEVYSTQQELHEGVYIRIYDVSGQDFVDPLKLKDAVPFVSYEIKEETGISWKSANGQNRAINDVIMEAWKALDLAARKTQYTFAFAMQATPNAEAQAKDYIASDLVFAKEDGSEVVQTKRYNMTTTLSETSLANNFNGDDKFFIIKNEQEYKEALAKQFEGFIGEVTWENLNNYVEVLVELFEKADNFTNPILSVRTEYASSSYSYSELIDPWALAYFTEHEEETTFEREIKITLQIVLKDTVDENVSKFFAPSERVEIALGDKAKVNKSKADFSATNEAMAKFSDTYYEFLRAVGEGVQKVDAGDVFEKFHAKSVLFDISKMVDGKEVTLHLAFFYEKITEQDEAPTLQLWRVDEKGEKVDGADSQFVSKAGEYSFYNDVGNSYCSITDFDKWINKAFSDIVEAQNFDSKDGWKFKTKVIVSEESKEEGWLFDGEWSEEFTYPTEG